MLTICAELRACCEQTGHGLGAQLHDGGRLIRGDCSTPRCAPGLPRWHLCQCLGPRSPQGRRPIEGTSMRRP
jgi:hypothetical protein